MVQTGQSQETVTSDSHSTTEVSLNTRMMEVELGDARLRRTLTKAGLETLEKVLSCPDSKIDELMYSGELSTRDDGELDYWRRSYRRDPQGFLEGLQRKSDKPAKLNDSVSIISHRRQASPLVSQQYSYTPEVQKLVIYEKKAKSSLDSLAQREETYLVFQAFEDFPIELDDIEDCFVNFFTHYHYRFREGLDVIENAFPNAFLVFVANQAQKLFDGKNFWEQLFKRLYISDMNVGADFKRLFVRLLKRRRMPTYTSDERAYYYLYTAVLHGGLSHTLWSGLWKDTVLPICREFNRNPVALGGVIDGHMVLDEIKAAGKHKPPQAAMSVLEKAPTAMIAPMLDASLKVGEQAIGLTSETLTLVSSHGLPMAAMEALDKVLSSEQVGRSSRQRGGNPHGASLVSLPTGILRLDLGTEKLSLAWKRQRLPLVLLDHRIQFYVNGALLGEATLKEGIGYCLFDGATFRVEPAECYDVEIKLIAPEETDEEAVYSEVASLSQIMGGLKPHCLEFLEMHDGSYELRTLRERITRQRRVAYVIPEWVQLEPRCEMSPYEERNLSGTLGDTKIKVEIYDVSPGASGRLVDARTNKELSAWQENFSVTVDKTRRIGVTANGIDLYGVTTLGSKPNITVPIVSIETSEGEDALSSLEVLLMCDGRRVSVAKRLLWGEGDADSHADKTGARIMLRLDKALGLDTMLMECHLVCSAKNSGARVLSYRFAVVPVRDFSLAGLVLNHDCTGISAKYRLVAEENVDIVYAGLDRKVMKGEAFEFEEDSQIDEASLVFQTPDSGKKVDARFSLMGIRFELPKRIMESAATHPLCMADVLNIGLWRGSMKVRAISRRPGRRMLVLLGEHPLAYYDLESPGTHDVNLLSEPHLFLHNGNKAEDMSLILSISFGEFLGKGGVFNPSWKDVLLAKCVQGYDLGSFTPYTDAEGERWVRFDKPARKKLEMSFYTWDKGSDKKRNIDKLRIQDGDMKIRLPRKVSRMLSTRRKMYLRVVPINLFGKPQEEYGEDFPIDWSQHD